MADTIRRVSYYYTTIPDKPGEGTRLLDVLRRAGVNLLALHAFPSARKAQVDFVPSDAVMIAGATSGCSANLAGVLGRLASAKINVTALTGVCAGMGRYGAILWVKPKDVTKAAAALGAM